MILSRRANDDDHRDGFTKWPFMTTHSWGEYPQGTWKLEVSSPHTHTNTQLGSIELTLSFSLSLSLSPGTLQFASNASWPSGRMVSGSAWHQGGTLSHTLPLLTPLQAGHCEEGARGQKDEVNSQRKRERGEKGGRGA